VATVLNSNAHSQAYLLVSLQLGERLLHSNRQILSAQHHLHTKCPACLWGTGRSSTGLLRNALSAKVPAFLNLLVSGV
jgi:hypothetical protein